MRCLIAIHMPDWNGRITAGREHQARCNELAAAIRTFADAVQHRGIGTGDVVFDRPGGLTATMRIEMPDALATAA